MKFWKDIMSESSEGKYSSKKLWGHVFAALVALGFVMDGFHFYQIDHHLFDAVLIASGYYLGLRTLSKWLTRSPQKDEDAAKQ